MLDLSTSEMVEMFEKRMLIRSSAAQETVKLRLRLRLRHTRTGD